jgi:beta-phosphoglucomutase-like phosphatase (HAD superfamily)
MVISAGPASSATTRRHRITGRPPLRIAPQNAKTLEVAAQTPRPLELDTVSSHWQVALDSAQRALVAAVGLLPAREVERRAGELVQERQQTEEMLGSLAHVARVRPAPWLSLVPVTPKMIGLPATTNACLFDLDGVLTDSAILHAWAWAEVLDEFLLRVSEKADRHFIPFDKDADYLAYIDGRPRLEGVHAFLGSRGIRLPEGRFDDSADADTACGLANRKGEVLARRVRQRGSTALAGARRYLEAAGHAGLKRAVISASGNTLPMLELAGLATLIEQRVDADVIRTERLRSRPAPDVLLAACRRLGVGAGEAVTFTHNAAGVAAGFAAGLAVIGVGDGARGELLQGFGAERVVPSLSVLLDRRLSEASR